LGEIMVVGCLPSLAKPAARDLTDSTGFPPHIL
jgi:hypothetical protein